jgi:hypothetical protein
MNASDWPNPDIELRPAQVGQERENGGEQQAGPGVGQEQDLERPGVADAGDHGADHRAHAERGVLEGEIDRERALLAGRFGSESGDHRLQRREHRGPARAVHQQGRQRGRDVVSPGQEDPAIEIVFPARNSRVSRGIGVTGGAGRR